MKEIENRLLAAASSEQVRWQNLDAYSSQRGGLFTVEEQFARDALFDKWYAARSVERQAKADYARTLSPAQIASLGA